VFRIGSPPPPNQRQVVSLPLFLPLVMLVSFFRPEFFFFFLSAHLSAFPLFPLTHTPFPEPPVLAPFCLLAAIFFINDICSLSPCRCHPGFFIGVPSPLYPITVSSSGRPSFPRGPHLLGRSVSPFKPFLSKLFKCSPNRHGFPLFGSMFVLALFLNDPGWFLYFPSPYSSPTKNLPPLFFLYDHHPKLFHSAFPGHPLPILP